MKKLFLVLIASSLLVACGKKAEVLIVSSERSNCTGVAPQKCLKIKAVDDKDWSLWYSGIEGFEWEPGYEYTLEIERVTQENTPADASSVKLVLVKVVEKKHVEFQLGKEYEVVSVNDSIIGVVDTTEHIKQPFIRFENGKASGVSACNNFSTTYELKENTLTVGPVAGTMMLCSEGAMKIESEMLKIMEKPMLLERIGSEVLVWQDNKQVMTLKEK